MNEQGYKGHIQEQVDNWPKEKPITTVDISKSLVNAFDMDMEAARKITNVNMKRLADKGELLRIQRGVYSKVRETAFGKLALCVDEVMVRLLMRDDDNVIGYFSGPTLLNLLGICSWVPRDYHIASNRYRHKLPNGTHVQAYKPVLPVNKLNAPYLRALDALISMEKYPVDVECPNEILRDAMHRDGIDNEKLIWYARNYYGQKTLLKAIDVALEGIVDETA